MAENKRVKDGDLIQPWETISSKILYRDSFKHLEVQECRLPNGKKFPRYYVDRYYDWVNVVALTPEGQFIFVRQYRHAFGEVTLETAAGTLDPGETDPDLAAQRELIEETGYHPETIRKLGELAPNPALQDNLLHIYLAEGCIRRSSQALDTHETIEVVLMSESGVLSEIDKGTFKHALALVALLMYFHEQKS